MKVVCYAVPCLRMLYWKIWKARKGKRGLQLVCFVLVLPFITDVAWTVDFPNMGENITMQGYYLKLKSKISKF